MSQGIPGPAAPAPAPRPEVPFAASCLTWFVGAAILLAVCGGGVVFSFARRALPRVEASQTARRAVAEQAERVARTKQMFELLAARLVAELQRGGGEFPETLKEAPPADAWDRPIRYERLSGERAVLRSSGPDRQFGTKDDVERAVEAR